MILVSLDTSRHDSIFDAGKFHQRRIDVIGVGATGSKLVLGLAKLGIQNIHVWDFDRVEPHNLANQTYLQRDIGRLKTDALADMVREATGGTLAAHHEKWEGQPLGEFVFAMPDTMAARRDIFDALRFKPDTKRVFDSRMGVGEAQLYSYRPTHPRDRVAYEGTLFSDDAAEVPVSACGTAITVGPTGDVIVGLMIWQLIAAVNDEQADLPWLAVSAQGGFMERIG